MRTGSRGISVWKGCCHDDPESLKANSRSCCHWQASGPMSLRAPNTSRGVTADAGRLPCCDAGRTEFQLFGWVAVAGGGERNGDARRCPSLSRATGHTCVALVTDLGNVAGVAADGHGVVLNDIRQGVKNSGVGPLAAHRQAGMGGRLDAHTPLEGLRHLTKALRIDKRTHLRVFETTPFN